ncbi:MAG: SDR family oxidoreductase [Verrucomicrobia bacterium]|nr:SDR family oxidoreductase [Verrucomicrobiota bacterium]
MKAHANPRAWITGAGGLIGHALVHTAPQFAPGWQIIGLTRQQLDLADFVAVREAFHRDRPQLIIHCAALSRSPACQADPARARKLNVEVTAALAELAADIPLVFFSSDLVFDGCKGNYAETDPVSPLSVYGETKAAAEQVVLSNPRHTVIRTSLNGGTSPSGDRGFNEEMRRAWQQGKTLTLFTDEFRSPIPAVVTARAVWELVGRDQPGLYHLAGRERLSRWQIGQLLAARWPQLHPRLQPGSLRDYQGAPRSPDTSLDCARLQQFLSFPLPGLSDWLRTHPHEPF